MYSEEINRDAVKNIYRRQKIQFPMIMSVIEGNSEGAVYCDNAQNPQHIFVRNKFGFCQEFFESFSEKFFQTIIDEIIKNKTRTKLRMYMPTKEMQEYLTGKENVTESERMHYIFYTNEARAKSVTFDGIRISGGGYNTRGIWSGALEQVLQKQAGVYGKRVADCGI